MKFTNLLLATALATSTLFAAGDITTDEAVPTQTLVEEPSGVQELKQRIVLYGWLPTLDGSMTFEVPGEPDESTDVGLIDSLDAVFMGSYSVRKDKWSFLADFIYLKLSGETPGINSNVNWDIELTSKIYGFYGGYNISQTDKLDMNFIAGVRYFGFGIDATRSGGKILNTTLSPSVDLYDAVVGVNGEYNINENWYLPYQFDIGTGDSDFTWQANVSVAYRYSWGDVIGTYRYIHYSHDGSGLFEDMNLYGPKLGVVFHF